MINQEKDEESDQKKNDWAYYFVFGLLFIVLITLIWWDFVSWLFPHWGHRGTFGDSFGGLNALFPGFAFGGVIYAIILQKQELALQREEIRLTRNELRKSAHLVAITIIGKLL